MGGFLSRGLQDPCKLISFPTFLLLNINLLMRHIFTGAFLYPVTILAWVMIPRTTNTLHCALCHSIAKNLVNLLHSDGRSSVEFGVLYPNASTVQRRGPKESEHPLSEDYKKFLNLQ